LILIASLVAAWAIIGLTVICLCAMASGGDRAVRTVRLRSHRFARGSSSGLRPTA
jgi:hypothetical protein